MIGTYYRLSLADEDVGADKAESNSIQGQRGLVEGYIMARPELAAEPRQEYVDDGYSGTSTSRPAFQRLIEDAQDGKVKTIIVKDFSRFARDYIEAGDYMERIFPLGIRVLLYWMSPNGKQALLQYRFRNVKNLKIYLCQIYRDSLKTYNNRAMRLLREECRHEFWASYEPASDNSGGKPENECWERCYPYSWESGLYLRFAEERSEVYCDYSVHR